MAAGAGPGRSGRGELSLIEAFRIFPDEEAAERWFAKARWGRRGSLPSLRGYGCPGWSESPDDALSVSRLPS